MIKKKNHPGPSSILKANQDNLLKFVAEIRDTGLPINAKMVQLEQQGSIKAFTINPIVPRNPLWRGFSEAMLSYTVKGHIDPKSLILKQDGSHLTSSILFIPLSIKQNFFQDLYTTVTNQEFFNPNIKRTLEK